MQKYTITALVLTCLIGCKTEPPATGNSWSANPSSEIYTVSYCHQAIAEQLIGSQAPVLCPAAESPTPDSWQPPRDTLAKIQQSRLIICNGRAAPYASWLQTASLPSNTVCELASEGLSLRDLIAVDDIRMVHSHGPEGEHSHPTMVSRIWLDPIVLNKQLQHLAIELCQRFPDSAIAIKEKEGQLSQQLKVLADENAFQNGELLACLSATPEMKFLTRYAKLNDRHFDWRIDTSIEDVKKDLDIWQRQRSRTKPETETTFKPAILFPKRLAELAKTAAAEFETRQIRVFFVDLIDRPDSLSLTERIKNNLKVAAQVRRVEQM